MFIDLARRGLLIAYFENILKQIFPLSNKKRIFVLKERKLYYGNT